MFDIVFKWCFGYGHYSFENANYQFRPVMWNSVNRLQIIQLHFCTLQHMS